MITYQVENWFHIRDQIQRHWASHYDELAQDKAHMPLDPDLSRCDSLAACDRLHIVTVRCDGHMIGYHASIIDTLMHYKTVLAAIGDLYWLHPDYRKAGIGRQMFQKVAETCKARGVKVLFDIVKTYADHTPLLEAEGYNFIEKKFSKWIGD